MGLLTRAQRLASGRALGAEIAVPAFMTAGEDVRVGDLAHGEEVAERMEDMSEPLAGEDRHGAAMGLGAVLDPFGDEGIDILDIPIGRGPGGTGAVEVVALVQGQTHPAYIESDQRL